MSAIKSTADVHEALVAASGEIQILASLLIEQANSGAFEDGFTAAALTRGVAVRIEQLGNAIHGALEPDEGVDTVESINRAVYGAGVEA